MRRCLLLIGCLFLSACLSAGRRGADLPPTVFDLGGAMMSTAERRVVLPIALEVRAPAWLDTMGIDYRLLYRDGGALREYAQARWSAPPSQLLQHRLTQSLALQTLGQVRTRCLLRVELNEFAQVFETPAQSRGEVLARVQLLDRSRRVLAERPLTFAVPAGSADSRGGVMALQEAIHLLSAELKVWLSAQLDNRDGAVCAG